MDEKSNADNKPTLDKLLMGIKSDAWVEVAEDGARIYSVKVGHLARLAATEINRLQAELEQARVELAALRAELAAMTALAERAEDDLDSLSAYMYTNDAEAAATASPAALRVIGQRDLANGCAHLWIDNRTHTWRDVVAGAVVTPVSGTVRVALGRPGAAYIAQWYDTRTRLTTTRQTLTADAAGVVTLTVTNLATDTAVRLQRAAQAKGGE